MAGLARIEGGKAVEFAAIHGTKCPHFFGTDDIPDPLPSEYVMADTWKDARTVDDWKDLAKGVVNRKKRNDIAAEREDDPQDEVTARVVLLIAKALNSDIMSGLTGREHAVYATEKAKLQSMVDIRDAADSDIADVDAASTYEDVVAIVPDVENE